MSRPGAHPASVVGREAEAALFGATREFLGLGPEELAAILGTHLRTIFRWERNERAIPPYLWLTLAQMLIRKHKRPLALSLPLPEAARTWLEIPPRGHAAPFSSASRFFGPDRAGAPAGGRRRSGRRPDRPNDQGD